MLSNTENPADIIDRPEVIAATRAVTAPALSEPAAYTPEISAAIQAAAAQFADRPAKRQRRDGWTGEAQRNFLEAIANGDPVEYACRRVGMTRQAAYAFRTRANGAAFAAAWDACINMARYSYSDFLMKRVIEGVQVEVQAMDGRVSYRRHYDHRLGMALLNRMDKMAEHRAQQEAEAAARAGAVPRDALIARHWGDFLDMIEQADADNYDSDGAMVDGFVADRTPADADGVSRQDCQIMELTAVEAIDALDPIALECRTERCFREEADGTLLTCIGAPEQIIADDDDPYETTVVVPEDAWRPATPSEADIFHLWQAARARLDQLDAHAQGSDLLADMTAFASAVETWGEEIGTAEG